MATITQVSRVSAEAQGWMPGFRVWELKAYDSSGRVVAQISEDCGSNHLKMSKFVQYVADAGYALSSAQISDLGSKLSLSLPAIDNRMVTNPQAWAQQFAKSVAGM